MREQPSAEGRRGEILDRTVKRYFDGLGATWEDFTGKKVLDIGAGEGAFADAASRRGIEVVSFDVQRQDWNRLHRKVNEGNVFIQGDAQTLPFADGSFDVVISHAGPFGSGSEQVFKEAHRVLKAEGELRIGRTPILPDESRGYLPEKLPERLAAIRERSRAYVEKLAHRIGFSKVEYFEHSPTENGIVYCHFVLKK